MFQVVAYAYDAAIHCPDCAAAYPMEKYPHENVIDLDNDLDQYCDSENNPIHAVLSDSEHDYPVCCDDCHVTFCDDCVKNNPPISGINLIGSLCVWRYPMDVFSIPIERWKLCDLVVNHCFLTIMPTMVISCSNWHQIKSNYFQTP